MGTDALYRNAALRSNIQRLLTDRASLMFWGGGLIGGLGAMAAFFLSYPLGWHLGATIIVVLGGLFILAYIFSPRYGLLKRK